MAAAEFGIPAGLKRRTLRCAIYTRKSTEEGLEQTFNTLDAQRSLATAEAQSAAANSQLLQDQIAIFLALGGGWQP